MDQSTKQRIVGILVIAVVAYVLLPVLFDGQGSYQMPLESRIPEPVPFPVPPTVTAQRPVITADTDAIRITDTEPAVVSEPDVEEVAVMSGIEPTTDTVPSEQADLQQPNVPAMVEAPIATAEAPGLDSVGLPEGWSVRLAAFSSYANALNLVDELQSRGHPAYIREMPSAQGVLTAVFVGPVVDRASVQQLQQQLQQESGLPGIVVPYAIEEL